MTVGSSTISTIKPGRAADAIALTKKWEQFLGGHGAKNVRSLLLMSTSPMQVVLTWEAENNAASGALADKIMADPAFQPLMHEVNAEDSPVSSSMTSNWVEV
jgi:hypothetical protein